MEREARHSDGVERRRLMEKIKQSKATLQVVKQEYQQISAGGSSPLRAARDNELFGGGGGSGGGKPNQNNQSFNAMSDSNKTRARILENTNTQKETDDLLADSHRIANETREIGTAALNSIEDQTDMLIEAKESVDQTHLETKKAGQLLNTMSRRVFTNKLFLCVVVFLLLGINVLIIYFYHNYGSSQPHHAPAPAAPVLQQDDHIALNEKDVADLIPTTLTTKTKTTKKTLSTMVPAVPVQRKGNKNVPPPLHSMRSMPLQHNVKVGTPLKVSFMPQNPTLEGAAINDHERDIADEVGLQATSVMANIGRFKESHTYLRHESKRDNAP